MSRGAQSHGQRRASAARRRCRQIEQRLEDARARRRSARAALRAGAGMGDTPLLRAYLRDASLSVLGWRLLLDLLNRRSPVRRRPSDELPLTLAARYA